MNTSNKNLSNFQLLLAVTSGTQVKIQDPDRIVIPPFNPILPSPSINQIVVFSTEKPKIKFKLLYSLGEAQVDFQDEVVLNF